MDQEPTPRAPMNQTNENNESPSPDSKSDSKNCVTYVMNQCGKHSQKEMADLLEISTRTFFRKIKGLIVDKENYGKQLCEFCSREKEKNIPPSPSMSVITYEMKVHLRNACNGYKTAAMARVLDVKPHTLNMCPES